MAAFWRLRVYRDELMKALLVAAQWVDKTQKGLCTADKFIREYGDFYYYQALDGHEVDFEQRRVLEELQAIIRFHEEVQKEVVDRVFLGNLPRIQQQDSSIERISSTEVRARLQDLCQAHNVDSLLRQLS